MSRPCLPVLLFLLLSIFGKGQEKKGHVERIDPALDAIVDVNAKVEIIASGYDWCEGPLWLEKQKMLIYSDVPKKLSTSGQKKMVLKLTLRLLVIPAPWPGAARQVPTD